LVAQACNVGYKPLVDESNPAPGFTDEP
ncbi:MAG: hypothetical protein QOK16_2281, partial [Solirubrobacteraceae bacterium]|nr:hypothetical protein [Solirubrobacteraceae bacterium]